MPEIVAVPVPLVNFIPLGSFPVSVSFGPGEPEVVTVKVIDEPAATDTPATLVMAGALEPTEML